jgi:hypothetical protein
MKKRNWTESLARACARNRWWTVGIWIIALVLAVFGIVKLLGGALVTEAEFTSKR